MNKKGRFTSVFLGLLVSIFFLGVSYAAPQNATIKVGTLLSYTGAMPLEAKGVANGLKLYFDKIGWRAGGREIQLFEEDTELKPDVGLTKVRRLVEERGVHFIVGTISSAECLAINPYIRSQKVIQIIPCAFSRDITSPEKASYNIFRVMETTDQGNYPMGKWIYKNTSHRKIVTLGQDYVAGRDSIGAFKAGFEGAGGKVIKEIWPPMGTMDFPPFLAAADVKDADAAYAFFGGSDAGRFIQQFKEFGLKERLPLYGYTSIVDDAYLAGIGEAAVGIITQSGYPVVLNTPQNQAFVEAYIKKYGESPMPPNRYSETGYVAGQLIDEAAKAMKGEVKDTPRVAQELKKVVNKIRAPRGSISFDKYGQVITDMYVLRTEKKGGKLVNVIIDKIGKVSQEDTWGWWQKK